MSFVALGTVKIVKATPTRDVILRIVGAGSPVGIVAASEGALTGTATPSSHRRSSTPEREFFS
jgi:hypothetical protein